MISRPRSHRPGAFRGILAALLPLLSLAGCQMVGLPGAPPARASGTGSRIPGPEGAYHGTFFIEGAELQAALLLSRPDARALGGILDITPGVRAEGGGSWDGGVLRLELSYGGDCPGRITLVGRWDAGTDALTGTVRAADCTGGAEGSFRLTSRGPPHHKPLELPAGLDLLYR